MAPRKGHKDVIVSEEFRVQSEIVLRDFVQDENAVTYEFSDTLSNIERAWVHNYVKRYGLKSKSHGKDSSRKLTIYKSNVDVTNRNSILLSMNRESTDIINDFLNKYPVHNEKLDCNSRLRSKQIECTDSNMGQLTMGIPQLPSFAVNNELIQFRTNLPIWPMRETLMESIISNQVLIISGETGSGKTTQIPQFILDYSTSFNEKCRVICTQPRRISAVAVAERVASERGEKFGQTVGFHIRLESCVGPKTVLIYCTNGILLRTLMNGDVCLKSFTHIIVDEIHERDRFSDFLLICLRECLVNYPHLRLILMSATIDVGIFRKYFNNAPVIHIPGRLHPVTEYYLEDVLKCTNYESPSMTEVKNKTRPVDKRKKTSSKVEIKRELKSEPLSQKYTDLDKNLRIELEECIGECVDDGTEDAFTILLQLILSDHAPINFQHPETGFTGLMAAALHGNMDICSQLLNFGADIHFKTLNNETAFDLAYANDHVEVAQLLQFYENYSLVDDNNKVDDDDDNSKQLLDLYHRSVSDQVIDYDLLIELLHSVHMNNNNLGSVLVFLGGFDDIVTVKDRILNDSRFNPVPYEIYTLHGLMQISDQHRAFNVIRGKRKIILATNIAETSITIDDVIYVIDSGRVKEKSYDAITGICSLQSSWISQASAKQRAGRAGRTQPGICFHLFSKFRHSSMQEFATPEILRMPLHELCLQTKLLAPKETKIADFLSRALEPPSAMAVNSAIKHLQEIDALDDNENLTTLGQHLVDLPVEPRLAKMLIYSVIFKCIDPLLTIVSFLSYRDPFVLPNAHNLKTQAVQARKQFSYNTFSDHMILLRSFQAWQEARLSKTERLFCHRNYISSATMEMVVHIRSQLLAQLRAAGFVKTRPPGDIRELNDYANNWSVIKAVLTIGFYPNIAYINKNSMQIRTKKEKKILLHSSSSLRMTERNSEHAQCLNKNPTNWLIFEELSRSGNIYHVRSCTSVSSLTISLFTDNSLNNYCDLESNEDEDDEDSDGPNFTLNDWITFHCSPKLLGIVSAFRKKINSMVRRKIANPYKPQTTHDENFLHILTSTLLKEDQNLGLFSPPGIGQRPKIMNSNNYPNPSENQYKSTVHLPKQVTNKEQRIISEILQFRRVTNCHYSKYIPQSLDGNSSQNDPKFLYHEPQFLPNTPTQDYQPLQQNYTPMLTQNMQMLSMCNEPSYYNPLNYTYDIDGQQFYTPPPHQGEMPPPCYTDDFKTNGITVDMEGACALAPPGATTTKYEMCHYNYSPPAFIEPVWTPVQYHLPDMTSFYIIKTGSIKSMDVSISKKTWIFSPQTERKLLRVLQTGRCVILIFTVQGSNCYQGVARLLSGPSIEFSHYNLNCPVEWLSRTDITYEQVKHLLTPNFQDGDEINPNVGHELMMMFMNSAPKTPLQLEPNEAPAGRPITKNGRN